jgi:surface glycoprotein (TIGR04207 family)/PGF-CTERM protein
MTGNTNKTRAVFLAMLMVFSVFAGTVAFSGSAAASTAPEYEGNAVQYENSSDTGAFVEIPFSGNVSAASLSESNFTLLDDGDNITDEVVVDYQFQKGETGAAANSPTVIMRLNQSVPSDDLEVDISEDVVAVDFSSTITNPGEKSVVFAGQTLEHDTYAGPGGPDGGVDSQAKTTSNVTAYQGVTIAVNASNVTNQATFRNGLGNIDVTVEGEDNNYFQEGSTGTNSTVFTFDTSDRELGQYRIFLNQTDNEANRTFVNVRDLNLDIELDDLNVSTTDTIETDVSAVAGNRNFEAVLLDNTGDTVNTSSVTQLNGQGETDVDFDVASADEGNTLDTGTYTVEVTDNNTGITVESSEITVSEADDAEANFEENILSDDRGDILEGTIELTETDFATVSFGSDDDGVVANATFEDDDGDGEVTFYLNTFNTESTNDDDVFYLDSDSDDVLVAQDTTTSVGDLIDAGDYDLEVQSGDESGNLGGASNPVDDSDDVATVTLNERSTETFRTWTAPDSISVTDLEDVNEAISEGEITQSSDIANGDVVIHQLVASGFEGALDAQQSEDVSTDFLDPAQNLRGDANVFNLTVEEDSPGANQDPQVLRINDSSASVIADGPKDTYFVIFDTDNVVYGDSTGIGDDTALEANFSVISNDDTGELGDFVNEDEFDSDENEKTTVEYDVVEPEVNVDEPFNVSQAESQTVSGTTTLAPTTELRLRVRSQDGVSPSFLKTASPEVQADGTFSATFDFSEQNVGDEYDIIVDSNVLSSTTEESGEVVGSVATDTATPEPDTATPEPDTATPEPDTATPEPDTATPEPDTATPEPETEEPTSTPTSTPGFGVVVALTALLAAALLAVRRD